MKTTTYSQIKEFLNQKGFTITSDDDHRPWGGFFIIDLSQEKKLHTAILLVWMCRP